MNKTWKLAIVMLKSAGPLWASKKGSGWKSALLLGVIAVGFLPLVFAGVSFLSGLYDNLALIGQETALLGLGFSLVSLIIFLLGIFYVISVFYYSQDVEQLLPLPLKPAEILGAKFLVALLYEYLSGLILLAPLLITYGVKSGGGVLYSLFAFILYLLIPVLPLVLAVFPVMLFMRFTNWGKKKDLFRVIGGLIALVLAVLFQFFVQSKAEDLADIERVQHMILSGEMNILQLVTQMFPPSEWAALALSQAGGLSGIGYLALLTLLSAVSIYLFLQAGNRLYFAGVMGISESAAKRKKLDAASVSRLTGARSALAAYVSKEWKILWRTPVYLLNCVSYSLFMPLILLIPFIGRSGERNGMWALIGRLVMNEGTAGISLAVGTAVLLLIAGLNSTSVTAITRDGQGFFMNKCLPIPYRQILLAKLVPGTLLSLVCLLLLVAEATWLFGLSPHFGMMLLLTGVPGIILMNMLAIMVDLRLPKLGWGSEQEAVKQNLNTLFPALFGIVTGGLLVLGAFWLDWTLVSAAVVLTTLFVILDLVLYRVLVTKGVQWMENIEG